MIVIENLYKRFGKLEVLKGINMQFNAGEVVSLIGPNGSGKTTLIKAILGLIKPDKGVITVNGATVNGSPAYRASIGYMPQIGRYPDNMKVGQLLTMIREIRNTSNQDTQLEEEFNMDLLCEKPLGTLSGGTKQKVNAALAFLFNPPVLILDEPTAGLDPLATEILKAKIAQEKKKNKLIIVTSHVLSDLQELTTHVAYMQEGRLIFKKDLPTLQRETGEEKLGLAIAQIMRQQKNTQG
ncbi:MAG: ATP-binding cassette domain-containing protein [Bacteroidetes bacterium]|nr:ATP-binding cassette domain-containing protein [Bacteroidota bacterium]